MRASSRLWIAAGTPSCKFCRHIFEAKQLYAAGSRTLDQTSVCASSPVHAYAPSGLQA